MWVGMNSTNFRNKKHLKNVGPIRHCEPPHAHSPGVASGTVARRLRVDVHDDNNDNAWQRGPLWPHGMGPISDISKKNLNDDNCHWWMWTTSSSLQMGLQPKLVVWLGRTVVAIWQQVCVHQIITHNSYGVMSSHKKFVVMDNINI